VDNLDLLAAQTAQTIIADSTQAEGTEVDNLATKTLGVLQENGVYAATLFLHSRTSSADRAIAPALRKSLLDLAASHLIKDTIAPQDDAQAALTFITEHIANDLDTLLLVKQVWEQTLIYVRYGAKARR
jgi:hypothetical protein